MFHGTCKWIVHSVFMSVGILMMQSTL